MRQSMTKVLGSQQGAALLILMLALFMVTVTVLLKGLNSPNLEQALQKNTIKALAQGKELAISFAVANPMVPGGLPFPDLPQDGNYDGNGDCITAGFNPTQHLLGQWPSLREQGCPPPPDPGIPAFGRLRQDGVGPLWYAVSRNLVKSDGGNYPIINSDLPATGWLTVVNEQGIMLTQQAAVVIMAPGLALAEQNRGGAVPTANQFLEGATVNGTIYTNFAIEANDTGFILQPPNDVCNDRLVYITIDELMTVVTRRVAGEIRGQLDIYHAANGAYPADQATFVAALAATPSWFGTNDWLTITTYSQVTADQFSLTFSGCDITYTFGTVAISLSQPGC